MVEVVEQRIKCKEQGIKGPIDHTLAREVQVEAYSGLRGPGF